MNEALNIHVSGIVQGVGFRPFVYKLAEKYQVTGWVLNAVDGVHVHAEGASDALDAMVMEINDHAPAAAQVKQIDIEEVPLEGFAAFEIRFSDQQVASETTWVSPDLATCPDCIAELFDEGDRRYRYPFINCTNCGPRFTIISKLPYDRAQTSMDAFAMCPTCESEYKDPADRRFHAQPDACWECGPRVSWNIAGGQEVVWGEDLAASNAVFSQAVELLLQGGIVAVKGLGGFHLCCNADDPQALARLRERKHRDGKGFAVMLPSVDAARGMCHVSPEEEKVMSGALRPIVLLKKKPDVNFASGLADGLPELGVMLPYTPVQHILLHDFVRAGGRMLVMTSGNIHDEPIAVDDDEARRRLAGIADAFLGNNRKILSRFDDSVVRILDFGELGTAVQTIRRARGFAPAPLTLDPAILPETDTPPCVLAVGPEQKNTTCLLRGNQAFVSQHVGDLENAETYDAWLEAKGRLQDLYQAQPTLLAYDMHPEYLSTKWAIQQDIPRANVQHHHAHIVAAMAESGIAGPVCGFAFDGTGYGVDGAIWGGEVLLSDCSNFERFANCAYVPMPGGAAAVKNPLRMAYGVLWEYDLLDHPAAQEALRDLSSSFDLLDQMIEQGLNTPHTSSVGRLFDAASALLGICTQPTYEGQPAIMLEAACASEVDFDPRYQIDLVKNQATDTSTAQDTSVLLMDMEKTFRALLDDKAAGVPVGVIASQFHQAFAQAIVQLAQLVQVLYGINTVALAGGVFMNRTLMEQVVPALASAGFTVAMGKEMPPNDGAVSLGQAVIAWHAQVDEE